MRRVKIPTARLRRFGLVAEGSGIAGQQIIGTEALAYGLRQLPTDELACACGTVWAIKARSAATFEQTGAPIVIAMVHGAVVDELPALARRTAFRAPGSRP